MKRLVVPTAEQFVGWVKEATGANDGPWVEAIQRVTGNRRGDAWCASFVAVVLDLAYRGRNPLPRTASCDALLAFARTHERLVPEPEPGDVFLVLKTADDAVHTGVVTRVTPDTVGTIEGNTNPGGAVDGDGVYRRTRLRRELLCFIDLNLTP